MLQTRGESEAVLVGGGSNNRSVPATISTSSIRLQRKGPQFQLRTQDTATSKSSMQGLSSHLQRSTIFNSKTAEFQMFPCWRRKVVFPAKRVWPPGQNNAEALVSITTMPIYSVTVTCHGARCSFMRFPCAAHRKVTDSIECLQNAGLPLRLLICRQGLLNRI